MLGTQELDLVCKEIRNITPAEWDRIMILLNRTDKLSTFLEMIGRDQLNNQFFIPRSSKKIILIIGDSQIDQTQIQKISKKCKISPNRLEIVADYTDHYNFERTRENPDYQAIIVGPLPHKTKGVGDYTSIIQRISNEEGFPPVIHARDSNNELKITKNTLQNAFQCGLDDGVITT